MRTTKSLDTGGIPEAIEEAPSAAQTLRIVPQTLAQLAAEWTELLERRRAAAAAGESFFQLVAAELEPGQESV